MFVKALRKISGLFLLVTNRSQVQSSTFWVKGKEGIKDPKSWIKMLIFPIPKGFRCQDGGTRELNRDT
jgi:hypothetical protein